MNSIARFLFLAVALVVAGCTIEQRVAPVQPAKIDLLCIERNDKILMADFEPTLTRLIEQRGVRTRLYSGDRPDDCQHFAIYIANWQWDMAMYLRYVRIEIFDGFKSIGLAEYDATLGGLNLDKFGPTEAKLKPLVDQLFPA